MNLRPIFSKVHTEWMVKNNQEKVSGVPTFETYFSLPLLYRSNQFSLDSQENLPHPGQESPSLSVGSMSRDAQSSQMTIPISNSMELNPLVEVPPSGIINSSKQSPKFHRMVSGSWLWESHMGEIIPNPGCWFRTDATSWRRLPQPHKILCPSQCHN